MKPVNFGQMKEKAEKRRKTIEAVSKTLTDANYIAGLMSQVCEFAVTLGELYKYLDAEGKELLLDALYDESMGEKKTAQNYMDLTFKNLQNPLKNEVGYFASILNWASEVSKVESDEEPVIPDEYAKSGGLACPSCGSHEVSTTEQVQVQGRSA